MKRFHLFQIKWLVVVGSILLGLRYLYWRGLYTLNTSGALSMGISLTLYLAEIYVFISTLLFYMQTAKPIMRPANSSGETHFPTVDILVTMYDEPIDALYRTLVGCAAIDYPATNKNIYVLDNRDRNEVKNLAKQLGCQYITDNITYKDNECARIENLKHGLTQSTGELVIALECGQVPVASFLAKTIGFFKNPGIAFVQTSLHRLSPDPFQQALFIGRDVAHEQELFFKVIEPGLDRYNAAVSFGSGVIYRHTALNETLKSDMPITNIHLSALLHSQGWHSAYLNQNLILQTSASKSETFFRDRAVRIYSAAGLLLKGLPLWSKFTLGQRFGYLGLLTADLLVVPQAVFMLAPVAFVLGMPPVVASIESLLGYFMPYFILQIIARHISARRYRHPLWATVHETADISAIFIAISSKLQKQQGCLFLKKWLSHGALLLLILLGIQILGLIIGLILYIAAAILLQPILVGGAWIFYNLTILTAAATAVHGRPQKRENPRIFRKVNCKIVTPDNNWIAETVDISETGLHLSMAKHADLSAIVEIELGAREPLVLKGEVKRNEVFLSGAASVGICFSSLSDEQKAKLIQWLYCLVEVWREDGIESYTHKAALMGLLTAAGRAFVSEGNLHRSAPRYTAAVPCRLIFRESIIAATTIDMSATGISLRVVEDPGPLPPDVLLEVNVSGKVISVKGQTVWSRREHACWEIGIRLGNVSGSQLLNAALPMARVKVISHDSLQIRIMRTTGRILIYVISIMLAVLVVAVFSEKGVVQFPTTLDLQAVHSFFWLFFSLILIDGVKVYIEIIHRASPRRYESDLSQVTALIPCYNTGKTIEYTIEGLRQLLPNDRIIIVDDGSTDNTAEIARRMGSNVYSLKKNVGKAKAIGIGLQLVKTRYTLILDDDTRIQGMFLPTSLLEEGNTGVAFYVLPCRRTRENFDGKGFVSCLQRYEYAKSMEIGRRFQDKTLSVSCISGAIGLFKTDRLRSLYPFHSNIFPGEDLERTLIDLLKGGRVAFVNEPVWTICPDTWKGLTRQRLLGWNPGFYRLTGYYLRILFKRAVPQRLRFEMLYNLYVILSDPLKIFSFIVLLINQYWYGFIFLYLFYLALEIYPFITVEKKMPVVKYYLPALFVYPLYGIYNTFIRFAALFVWLWHRYITKKWKPQYETTTSL